MVAPIYSSSAHSATVDNNMNTLLKWLVAMLLMVLILIALVVLFDLASTQYEE